MHDQVETWEVSDRIKIIVHLLIDIKRVTVLECTYQNCGMPSRAFGVKRERPAIDHVLSRKQGGSNHWPNLQVIHLGCNSRKARFEDAGVPIDEFMARVREHNNYEWQRENQSTLSKAYWTDERRQEQSERMKAEWTDPEKRAQKLKVHGNAYKRRKDSQ